MDKQAVTERNDAIINGALVALGALGIIDNVIFHWLLGFHRTVPGPYALHVEIVIVIISTILLVVGLWREARAMSQRPSGARVGQKVHLPCLNPQRLTKGES